MNNSSNKFRSQLSYICVWFSLPLIVFRCISPTGASGWRSAFRLLNCNCLERDKNQQTRAKKNQDVTSNGEEDVTRWSCISRSISHLEERRTTLSFFKTLVFLYIPVLYVTGLCCIFVANKDMSKWFWLTRPNSWVKKQSFDLVLSNELLSLLSMPTHSPRTSTHEGVWCKFAQDKELIQPADSQTSLYPIIYVSSE